MFKRKHKDKPIRKRETLVDDNDDDDNENEGQTSTQIQQVKRKRLDLPHKRGTDASRLLHNNATATKSEQKGVVGTTSVSHFPSAESREPSKEGVIERKHQQAMEAFIDERLGQRHTVNNSTSSEPDNSSSGHHDRPNRLTHDELYQELASRSQQWAGKAAASERTTDGAAATNKDGDVGSGGALVAGTGIAEVLLPLEERLATVSQTARAASQRPAYKRSVLPTSTAAPRGTMTAVPNRFASRRLVTDANPIVGDSNHNNNKRPSHAMSTPSTIPALSDSNDAAVDADRVGFEALRRQRDDDRQRFNPHRGPRQQPSDNRVYRNFVNKQRELQTNRR